MFDSGMIALCTKHLTSSGGSMPKETLHRYACAFYGERSVSYSRMYEARGADCQIDMLVRVPFDTQIQPDSYAVFEGGDQYRVDAVSPVIVRRDTRAQELTLIRLDELLDVEEVVAE